MANKRMINNLVINTDAFLDMPLSAQALYFHLNFRADDDGFVGNPRRVARDIGANNDDLKILIGRRFVLEFEDGIIVIKHWRMHNTLSANRYHETIFKDQKSMLKLKDNKAYSLNSGEPIDDSRLIEMASRQSEKEVDEQKTNKRRTKDEQKTDSDIVVVVEVDKEKEKENNNTTTFCGEPTAESDVFITWLSNTNEVYGVTMEYLEQLKNLYPAVDVEQELRNMAGWIDANPTKRKTMGGMKRFITNWLSKAQDKGGSYQYRLNDYYVNNKKGDRESV